MKTRYLLLIAAMLLVVSQVFAAVIVTVNGSNYSIPQTNERGWGSAVTSWIQAISANTLQPSGGTFTLTADVDFGSNYGLRAPYLISKTTNPSTAGYLRLARTDSIGWRNAANGANLLLSVDGSNNLTFNGVALPSAGTATFSDAGFSIYDDGDPTKLIAFQASGITGGNTRTITVPDASVNLGALTNSNISGSAAIDYSKLNLSSSILNADVNASAAIAYSKLNLGTSIVNSDINASAGIALNKLAATTVSRALVSDSSGFVAPSTTTSTEIGYVNGVTSSIQTQLDAKILKSTLSAKGSIVSGSAANTPFDVTVGSDGQVLTADSASTGGVKWAAATAAPISSHEISNLGFSTSVGSNALTISLKQFDGTDPSSGAGAVKIGFRSSTSTSGQFAQRSVTASLSLVISSGSTLGTTSAATENIYLYAIDNAGTVELAVSRSLYIDEGILYSTTAEGGAGAADSATALYSATSRSNVAIRLIGRITISETTAGTWATNATILSLAPFKNESVTSNSLSGIRIEYAQINTNASSSCTVSNSSSSWISTTYVSGATCSLTFSPAFSAAPICALSSLDNSNSAYTLFAATYAPTTTGARIIRINSATGSQIAGDSYVICIGPR